MSCQARGTPKSIHYLAPVQLPLLPAEDFEGRPFPGLTILGRQARDHGIEPGGGVVIRISQGPRSTIAVC